MKKIALYSLFLVFCLSACQKDYKAEIIKVSTGKITNITGWSADVAGDVQAYEDDQTLINNPNSRFEERGLCWNTTGNPSLEDAHVADLDTRFGNFVCTANDLMCGTTYFVRTYAKSNWYIVYGEEHSFATPDLAKVKTNKAKSITGNTAIIEGKMLSDGGSEVKRCGILYGPSTSPAKNDKQLSATLKDSTFSCKLLLLQPATTYRARAYVETAAGIAYGNTISFTTLRVPKVKTKGFSNRTDQTVTIAGQIVDAGGDSISACGICYNNTGDPTISDMLLSHAPTLQEFQCTITSMTPMYPYFACAYATNMVGTSYGEVIAFYWKPTLDKTTATTVEYTSITCSGNILSNGGQKVTECGICYATTSEPTIQNQKAIANATLGKYTCTLPDLQAGKTYYCRAYAINSEGVAYGESCICKTKTYSQPNVETLTAEDVTYNQAICSGNILSDGGKKVTECGICYATISEPTIQNQKNIANATSGKYTCTLTDLQDGMTYYYRAYAINSEGIAYGEQHIFKTLAYALPDIQTLTAKDITEHQATCSGNVRSDGGKEITQCGICYSTTHNPTIGNGYVSSSIRAGNYTCTLRNLQPETTYYYRAFATNALGTAYGNEFSFETSPLPIVSFSIIPSGTTFTQHDIAFRADIGNGSTAPAYFDNYKTLRIYAQGTLTISSSVYTLHEITITTDQPDLLANITSNAGTISISTDRKQITWTGNASEVILNVGRRNIDDTKAGRLSIKSFDILAQ